MLILSVRNSGKRQLVKTFFAALSLAIPVALSATPPRPVAVQAGNTSATESDSSTTIGQGTDKVICKREKTVGSRVTAKKVCQTAAQWERQRRDDQQMAEKIQSSRWKSD